MDEYDKPLLETMVLSEEQIKANRAVFKGMFGQLKSLDGKLRFVLFTGVTKFSKVSIFSDLNQLCKTFRWTRTSMTFAASRRRSWSGTSCPR